MPELNFTATELVIKPEHWEHEQLAVFNVNMKLNHLAAAAADCDREMSAG